MENILMDGYHLSPYTCKRCTVFKQFDRLSFDGLAGKCQKCQNIPHQNFALYGKQILVREGSAIISAGDEHGV